MPIGDVVEWQGEKYAQVGENPKDKASWKPVRELSSVPSKPYTPSGERPDDPFETPGKIAGGMFKTAMLPFDLLDKAAYDAGGWVTDKTGSPELGYLANLATQVGPSILGGGLIEKGIMKPAQGVGRWLMQKAVKPGQAARASGDAAKAVETLLKEGVNVTSGGMSKFSKEVKQLAGEVDDIVNTAQAQGKSVAIPSVLGPVAQTRAGDLGKQVNRKKDLAKIDSTLDEFLTDSRVAGKTEIPIRTAQDMKTSTYRTLDAKSSNPYSGELTSADIEAQKSIIKGLKEGIERAAPEVTPRNKRMSELLNAIEVVEPRALLAGNKDPMGLAYLAHNPFVSGAMLLDRSELAKSILARLTYTGVPKAANVGAASILGAQMQ